MIGRFSLTVRIFTVQNLEKTRLRELLERSLISRVKLRQPDLNIRTVFISPQQERVGGTFLLRLQHEAAARLDACANRLWHIFGNEVEKIFHGRLERRFLLLQPSIQAHIPRQNVVLPVKLHDTRRQIYAVFLFNKVKPCNNPIGAACMTDMQELPWITICFLQHLCREYISRSKDDFGVITKVHDAPYLNPSKNDAICSKLW